MRGWRVWLKLLGFGVWRVQPGDGKNCLITLDHSTCFGPFTTTVRVFPISFPLITGNSLLLSSRPLFISLVVLLGFHTPLLRLLGYLQAQTFNSYILIGSESFVF